MNYSVNQDESNENHFKQKTIKSLAGYTFRVEDYQRGYKWGFNQVLDLLNDIESFDSNGVLKSYCLQPVAVKRLDEVSEDYELVDGQQRLTTVYIILKICRAKDLFKIRYKTRPESETFLRDIGSFGGLNTSFNLYGGNLELKTSKTIGDELNSCWQRYVAENQSFDNVDNYHFYQAALVIRNYFDAPNHDADAFVKKLKNHVKVIWYQDPTGQSANELFKNLNSGKIRLSASELIKALFILSLEKKGQPPSQIEFEQNKLASEWDDIERQLHEPAFWSFIIGNTTRNYEDSRIGYLFEVLTDTIEHKNPYECYRIYSNAKESNSLDWATVTELFFTLKEWFDDIKTYHRIGFLMRQNIGNWKTLRHIYNEYQSSDDKDGFELKLEGQLKELFHTTKRRDNQEIHIYSLDAISYQSPAEVRNLLVLVNIVTYERIMSDYRVDFDQFYNSAWSIEHIQPQNPKDVSFENVDIYLDEMEGFLGDIQETDYSKIKEVRKGLSDLKKAKPEEDSLEKEKRAFLSRFENFLNDSVTSQFDLHGIGNLALLRSTDNSSLGNKSFKSKREQIINSFNSHASAGSFVPISTLQVFTKFHSKNRVQLNFWSYKDALFYKNSIADIMKIYLPKNV